MRAWVGGVLSNILGLRRWALSFINEEESLDLFQKDRWIQRKKDRKRGNIELGGGWSLGHPPPQLTVLAVSMDCEY